MAYTYWARIDSGTAKNPALNLTGDPARQITFVASGDNGDLIAERPADGGMDPDTQVVIGGVTYDFTFELSGTLPTQNRDGAQQVPEQYEGAPVYVITIHDYPAPGETTRLTFLPEADATEAEMNSFGNGAIDIQNLDETPPPGPVCFGSGTLLLTPRGPVAVEHLAAGDLVETLDEGAQPILWQSHSRLTWPLAHAKDKPIVIAAGALGPGQPVRDLVVSPQHRVLLSPATTPAAAGEVFAPAKGLVGLPGVRRMRSKRSVVYHHILLPRHAIVLANGTPCETFLPGPVALARLRAHQRAEVIALLPELEEAPCCAAAARPCLSCSETRALVRGQRGVPNLPLAA